MKIRFWGARGSVPTPCTTAEIERKIIQALRGATGVDLTDEAAVAAYVQGLPLPQRGTYGGNTPCVEVRTSADDLLILDAGSGLRGLGFTLTEREFGRGEGEAYVLFSHTHWDHIQGWPFFDPAYIPGNRFHILSGHEDLEERLQAQQDSRFFPMPLSRMGSTLDFTHLRGAIDIYDGRVRVTPLELNHPGGCFAYRIEADGKAFVYATDAEYQDLAGPGYEKYVDFYRGADVLLFDAQYTLHEALVEKYEWGHSSALIGVDIASEAGIGTLVLFHHEPKYDDDKIDQIFRHSLRYVNLRAAGETCRLLVAYEGLELEL